MTAVLSKPDAKVRPATFSYSSDDIKKMLPHRWPMLMIDRAYDVIPGESGKGLKSVSVNEPFFAGHYPDHSIMPGVMIVESMAQLVAVIYVAEMLESPVEAPEGDVSDQVGYLGAIKSVKFNKLVVPGDQLVLSAQLGPQLGGLRSVTVKAAVDGQTAASGSLIVTTGRAG
jgi:3-hydroxyacyl-[acyl-carrier-protein] dehydratase